MSWKWDKPTTDQIKDLHIKKIHKSGLMDLKHAHPGLIFDDCPLNIIQAHKELRIKFDNYIQMIIDEATERDGIKHTDLRRTKNGPIE